QTAPAQSAQTQQDESTQQAPVHESAPEQTGRDSAQSGSAEGTNVNMPALGESVTEGTITRWLKQVGETVEVDEPLLEVSTDKVDTEVPSPIAGTVLQLVASEDDTVEVGSKLAVVGEAGSEPAQATVPPQPAPAPQAPS